MTNRPGRRPVLPVKERDQIRSEKRIWFGFSLFGHFAYLGFSSLGSLLCGCVSCVPACGGDCFFLSFWVYPPFVFFFLLFADEYGTWCGRCAYNSVVMRCRQYGGTTLGCAHHRYRWLFPFHPSSFPFVLSATHPMRAYVTLTYSLSLTHQNSYRPPLFHLSIVTKKKRGGGPREDKERPSFESNYVPTFSNPLSHARRLPVKKTVWRMGWSGTSTVSELIGATANCGPGIPIVRTHFGTILS
jgi:hypothetical protein